ncbi:hypothetical protein Y1Q_0007565 [Alligator mississippiensis]|uniref:Uncharacterized protein n=1 Tax=Alligator mississippiensis TaxID=8496 RepID=A0A151PFK9_ALLMI|nr:hypothetical protein Y1Q_0007565 [Alligator mississippiensis]
MKQRRWRVKKKPKQKIHHLLLLRPKNMLNLLAWAVSAVDLFPKLVLVLMDFSGARMECADAWQGKLHEPLHKDDAILKEVQDTMWNFKDVVD